MTVAPVPHYSSSYARQHFSSVLDAAERGRVVTVNRGKVQSAVISADRLRHYLSLTTPARTRTTIDDGAYVVFLEDRPFVSEGDTLEEAIADLIESMREYAEDWVERLQYAPNHADAWGLVQLVNLSTDEQLAGWLRTAE